MINCVLTLSMKNVSQHATLWKIVFADKSITKKNTFEGIILDCINGYLTLNHCKMAGLCLQNDIVHTAKANSKIINLAKSKIVLSKPLLKST